MGKSRKILTAGQDKAWVLKDLDPYKIYGPDEISLNVLKKNADLFM